LLRLDFAAALLDLDVEAFFFDRAFFADWRDFDVLEVFLVLPSLNFALTLFF
jgi:hypothetical protein